MDIIRGRKTPIIEKTLIDSGFRKKCNMWLKNGYSLELIQGHTWVLGHASMKYGKDVRSIEQINSIINGN